MRRPGRAGRATVGFLSHNSVFNCQCVICHFSTTRFETYSKASNNTDSSNATSNSAFERSFEVCGFEFGPKNTWSICRVSVIFCIVLASIYTFLMYADFFRHEKSLCLRPYCTYIDYILIGNPEKK